MLRLPVVLLMVMIPGSGCARAYPPPGGEPDELPPRLISTSPEPLSVVTAFRDAVVFRFDERLSERGFSEALVIVSPLDGALRVERRRTEVRVSIDGGWRENRVYRVVLLPGVRDLFGNTRNAPIELIFSTGPPIANTAIAGMVLDRITGRAAANPVVDAVRRADSVRYVTIADTAGFFALRHLPLGVYDVRAYSDANRNRRRDPAEPVDSGRIASLAQDADTVPQIFQVLAPDTTAPNVQRAATIDSMHVRVVVDDYVSDTAAAAASVEVRLQADSTVHAFGVTGLLETVFTRQQQAIAAAARGADRAAADTAGAAAADTVVIEPAETVTAQPIAPGVVVPAREIVFLLNRALSPDQAYFIVVSRLANLHGLIGGGSADFETAAPPPPPPEPDTAQTVQRRR